ncbi:hypothetical protein ACOMHN_000507 [Nucella lapillus]
MEATRNPAPPPGTKKEWTEAVGNAQWTRVLALAQSLDCGQQQRLWALTEIVNTASNRFVEDRIDDILDICTDDQLDSVLPDLIKGAMWNCVGRVLVERSISSSLLTRVVQEALKHADCTDLCLYVLPHCADRNRDLILRRMVSGGDWQWVDKVLELGVSPAQHQWALEEALKKAEEQAFATSMLHHCSEQDLEKVLRQMVSKGLWEPLDSETDSGVRTSTTLHHVLSQIVSKGFWEAVSHFVQRAIDSQHHRWAMEEGSKYAGEENDVDLYITPQCCLEELESILPTLVSRGLWYSVDSVLERGVSPALHRWVVIESLKVASEEDFSTFVLPHSSEEDLEQVLQHMVSQGLWKPRIHDSDASISHHVLSQIMSRGLWEAVGNDMEKYLSTAQHWWAIAKAAKHADEYTFEFFFLRHCSDEEIVAVFAVLVANKKWKCVKRILYNMVHDTLYTWIASTPEERTEPTLLWKFVHDCRVELSLAMDLMKVLNQEDLYSSNDLSMFQTSCRLAERVSWKRALCQSLVVSFVFTLCSVACSDGREHMDSSEHTKQSVSHIYRQVTACIENSTDASQQDIWKTMQTWTSVFNDIANPNQTNPLFLLYCLQGLNLYHASRRGRRDDGILLVMLAVLPLSPYVQHVVLRMMLREKRWEVINQACLSHVWEHDREELFKAAVEQSQWDVVEQWADHTLDDDQRDWAMKEAFKEKQWMAYLLLADHGLTMEEHMHAVYIVAKYGNWDTVLEMVERGGDLTEVSNMLETWVLGNLRKKPKADTVHVFWERCEKLLRLRYRFERNSLQSPWKALKHSLWGSILFNILHGPSDEYFSQVLHKVIEEEEWHILLHLVRLGMNATERDWLFPQMVRQQQWGVCRKLLEIGVDIQLCLEALPELMDRNQWALVARVMDYDVDDAVRLQLMHSAFQRREGVLFWHCLTTLKKDELLSTKMRSQLFHQAIGRDIWQVVKPLIENPKGPGVQQRDVAFLEAIELHLWDVVDHCQIHGADINMEDENGETPLHREARKEEWKAVEEIVVRDGKPNLLDKNEVSVLNRLIDCRQWETVKLVIKYGGNIHLPARRCLGLSRHTPLQRMIDERQMDVIHFTVKWCPEQRKGVNEKGETTLHAACWSDRWDVMRDLIMRKVDTLAVTGRGQTALVYAVLNRSCPQRMVAECCRLGFSSLQPLATSLQTSLYHVVFRTVMEIMTAGGNANFLHLVPTYCMRKTGVASPFVCAVLLDLPAVAVMLFESGSSSYAELFTVCPLLINMLDPCTDEGRKVRKEVQELMGDGGGGDERREKNFTKVMQILQKYSAFLRRVALTPRSLVSSCRLLISRRFQDKRRHQHICRLPVPDAMKKYLEFLDFLDPDFGRHVEL